MKKILSLALLLAFFLSCDKMPVDPFRSNPVDSDANASSVITFASNYGGPGDQTASAIVKTSDEGYALIGTSDRCIYLVKTNRYGKLVWQKTYQFPGYTSRGRTLRQTPDGGFILAGDEGSELEGGFKLIKTDKNGNLQWQQRYDSITGADIALSHDNNGYVGTGSYFVGPGSFHSKALIFKVNAAGNLLWTKTYVKTVYAQGFSIERTSDNGFIVAGASVDSSGFADMYLLKVTAQGSMQWQKTWGGSYWDRGYHAVQTRDGGYAIVGYKSKDYESFITQIYLVRTDSEGKYKWIKGYFPASFSTGYQLQETSDRGFVIAGMAYTTPALIKVSSNGSYQWRKNYSVSILDEVLDVAVANDGGYAITGPVYIDSDRQAALVKTDENGNL